MLDIGFRPAVETILQAVPEPRQILLLSATMPPGVCELAGRYLERPGRRPPDRRGRGRDDPGDPPGVPDGRARAASSTCWSSSWSASSRRRAIVFCRTKRGADKVGDLLRAEGLQAEAMHGNLSQSQRNRVLQASGSGG